MTTTKHQLLVLLGVIATSTVSASGTFKLYDVAGQAVVTTLENRGTYDLAELGPNPQVTVLYESDEAQSAILKVYQRKGTTWTRLSRECDITAPFYASETDSLPVALELPLGRELKVIARESSSADSCAGRIGQDGIRFRLLNTAKEETAGGATTASNTPAPITPAPILTPAPVTAAPVITPAPVTNQPLSPAPTLEPRRDACLRNDCCQPERRDLQKLTQQEQRLAQDVCNACLPTGCCQELRCCTATPDSRCRIFQEFCECQ